MQQAFELFLTNILLSEICKRFNLRLIGSDRVIRKVGSLDTKTSSPEQELTYALNKAYVQKFIESDITCCIIPVTLEKYVTNDKTFLLTDSDAETVFYEIVTELGKESRWEKVNACIGNNNSISSSAIINDNVVIGDRCKIMDNVVIMPNTIIGNDVVVKPNTVIGGDGFLVKKISGKTTVVPHFGGVKIEDNVEIGSSVCIDRGMFGEFTHVGKNTKIDNAVHIGHSAFIGNECIITAGNIVGGSTTIGDNVWLGINSTINQLLNIGDSCFVGSGTVVIKSLDPYLLVVGSPARVISRVCHCRSKLEVMDKQAVCANCGTKYKLINDVLVEIN